MILDHWNGIGMRIDLTICRKTNADDITVNEKKWSIFLATISYFQQKYTINKWEVTGARGSEKEAKLLGFLYSFQEPRLEKSRSRKNLSWGNEGHDVNNCIAIFLGKIAWRRILVKPMILYYFKMLFFIKTHPNTNYIQINYILFYFLCRYL